MSLTGIRGLVYTLFATVVLSTLWVTSLTILSTQPNATALITSTGVDVLNPFLVKQGLGITQSTYVTLEADARARPAQALALPLLKVRVLGREIIGKTYPEVVQLVYARVADTYYTSGAGAVFAAPAELQQVLPNFALFNPDNAQVIPGGPTVSQLPPFLQPFFVFVGLTPTTFTQSGHQRLLGLLPWFWLVTVALGALAITLNPSEKKLAGLAEGVAHSTWPIVGVLVALWILSHIYVTTFAPYTGALAVIRGAFLPVYGVALIISLIGVGLITWLPTLRKRQQDGGAGTSAFPGATLGARVGASGGASAQTAQNNAPPTDLQGEPGDANQRDIN